MSVILNNLFQKAKDKSPKLIRPCLVKPKIRQKPEFHNKAQLKIQQMVFMLLAVTLFFVLVLLFYFSIKVIGLRQESLDIKREQAQGLITKISSTPEFIYEGDVGKVDFDKLMILKNKQEYQDFWGDVSGILVTKLYPESADAECSVANYPECNKITIFGDDGSPASAYVALCRKESNSAGSYDKCEMALLTLYIENEE